MMAALCWLARLCRFISYRFFFLLQPFVRFLAPDCSKGLRDQIDNMRVPCFTAITHKVIGADLQSGKTFLAGVFISVTIDAEPVEQLRMRARLLGIHPLQKWRYVVFFARGKLAFVHIASIR